MQNRKHFTPKCGRVRTFFLAPELQQREITLEEKTSGTIKIYTLNKGEFKNPLPSLLAIRAHTSFWLRNFPVFSASAFCSACGRVFVEWPARFDLKTPAGTTAGEDHVPRPSSSVHRSSLLPWLPFAATRTWHQVQSRWLFILFIPLPLPPHTAQRSPLASHISTPFSLSVVLACCPAASDSNCFIDTDWHGRGVGMLQENGKRSWQHPAESGAGSEEEHSCWSSQDKLQCQMRVSIPIFVSFYPDPRIPFIPDLQSSKMSKRFQFHFDWSHLATHFSAHFCTIHALFGFPFPLFALVSCWLNHAMLQLRLAFLSVAQLSRQIFLWLFQLLQQLVEKQHINCRVCQHNECCVPL